jgi:hypothetical protein
LAVRRSKEKFELKSQLMAKVKESFLEGNDLNTLELDTERRDLMGDFQAQEWEENAKPWVEKIEIWTPQQAKDHFLGKFKYLDGVD